MILNIIVIGIKISSVIFATIIRLQVERGKKVAEGKIRKYPTILFTLMQSGQCIFNPTGGLVLAQRAKVNVGLKRVAKARSRAEASQQMPTYGVG